MAEEKDQRILKILLAVILLVAVGLGIWAYNNFHENEAIKKELTREKEAIQLELDNISKAYADEIDRGIKLDNEIILAQERVERLVDSVDNLKADVKLLSRLRAELNAIKKERRSLLDRIDELQLANQSLQRTNDSTLLELDNATRARTQQDSALVQIKGELDLAAQLTPTNFTTTGVIIRSSGRQIENDRARRVDDLKVCFTLPANLVAKQGINSYYLQVINPENNVMGSGEMVVFDGQELRYSKLVEFNYTGKELDICELVGANDDNIIEGPYRINLFRDANLISSTNLQLR
ncbi:MAG: hypothetical protein WBA16_04395 [Nonlabens sp.]